MRRSERNDDDAGENSMKKLQILLADRERRMGWTWLLTGDWVVYVEWKEARREGRAAFCETGNPRELESGDAPKALCHKSVTCKARECYRTFSAASVAHFKLHRTKHHTYIPAPSTHTQDMGAYKYPRENEVSLITAWILSAETGRQTVDQRVHAAHSRRYDSGKKQLLRTPRLWMRRMLSNF